MQTKPTDSLPHPLNLRYWLTPKAERYLDLIEQRDNANNQLGQFGN